MAPRCSLSSLALALGGAYFVAARGTPPVLVIVKPEKVVGQTGAVELTAEAPNARFTALAISLEQNGKTVPLFSLDKPDTATVTPVSRNQMRIARAIGKLSVPELQSGPAKIVVTATRPSFLNLPS